MTHADTAEESASDVIRTPNAKTKIIGVKFLKA